LHAIEPEPKVYMLVIETTGS